MGDKIVCFHTLLKVLILREVTGGFSISADSKALAEMARAVSSLLTSPMDQCARHLYTLNHYTILFIFVEGERWGTSFKTGVKVGRGKKEKTKQRIQVKSPTRNTDVWATRPG